MSFDFIPRSIKRRKIDSSSLHPHPQVSTSVVSENPTSAGASNASEKASFGAAEKASKTKEKSQDNLEHSGVGNAASSTSRNDYNLEDLAVLVWLVLSEYALWSNSDLRRNIDLSVYEDDGTEDNDEVHPTEHVQGYVPLSYLFRRSPVLLQAASLLSFVKPPETLLVKAIRSHASNLLDIRMIVPDDASSSHWSKKPLSGYEVKRVNKLEVISNYGKVDWDRLTVYVENLPTQHRNLSSIAKFVLHLLSPSQSDYTKVQNISFPPHHNDQPGSYPSCKGFALITLSNDSDVKLLLDEWSWNRLEEKGRAEASSQNPDKLDALKSGFRCISKARWEELKEEYLTYRRQLLDELEAEQQRFTHVTITASTSRSKIQIDDPKVQALSETLIQPHAERIHLGSSFPPGCLVFVRHVHPETNKTTLRGLFSQAWSAHKSQTADGLDYLDYSKGLDTCYIRLSSPSHAEHFVNYFTTHPTTQLSGLDGSGTLEGNNTATPLILELVVGKREELYWQKVPEKIRRQAVEKALKIINGADEMTEKDTNLGAGGNREQGGNGTGRRRRKK